MSDHPVALPTTPYVPIDTDLVDDLEHYALDAIRVRIAYRTVDGATLELNGLIGEVFTENHAEFLRMKDGRLLAWTRFNLPFRISLNTDPNTDPKTVPNA